MEIYKFIIGLSLLTACGGSVDQRPPTKSQPHGTCSYNNDRCEYSLPIKTKNGASICDSPTLAELEVIDRCVEATVPLSSGGQAILTEVFAQDGGASVVAL